MRSESPFRPAIWAVSLTRLSRLISDVVPEFDPRAEIRQINLGFEEAARRIRQRLATEPCDVLIAAGSNGAYLVNRVPRPVVLVKASGFDLLQALARARQVSERIAVVTHQSDLPEFAQFQESFGLHIEQRSFRTAEDARHAVAELVARGTEVVVGTGLAVELAEQAGINGLLLYSADTIRNAFETALALAQAARAAPLSRRAVRAPVSRAPQMADAGAEALLGGSAAMAAVRERLRLYGPSGNTVLIRGDTGTGKELAARALHVESPRRAGPFVAVNCGALAESLLESELFGHEEGAFTGARRGGRTGLIEAADGGTLFLDEIGEMPLPLQTRLLRVIEEREVLRVGSSQPVPVDLRVIAATHRDLERHVRDGQFRRDLYYRLNVLRIDLPRLADRPEDLPMLFAELLQRQGGPDLRLDVGAEDLLVAHDWPGNIRELRNLVERIAAHAALGEARGRITAAQLRQWAPEFAPAASRDGPEVTAGPRPSARELRELLAQAGGRRLRVARQLGVSRTTLWRWLAEDRVKPA